MEGGQEIFGHLVERSGEKLAQDHVGEEDRLCDDNDQRFSAEELGEGEEVGEALLEKVSEGEKHREQQREDAAYRGRLKSAEGAWQQLANEDESEAGQQVRNI